MLALKFAAAVFILSTLCIQGAFGLSVSGNKLIDSSGNSVTLRGVVKPSFEWSAAGESVSLNDYSLMRQWGANVVRLPMNQDYWLSGSSSYNSNYQATIDQQVKWIKSLGMYVILDLHWSDQGNLYLPGAQQCMADADSATFWTQVATVYKNDPYILFELYNEPHDVTWPVWLNGGSGCGFTVYGMQQLYNAVRATGAQNVVIVSGLNWAFDLTGVASNGLTGTNIAYNTHPYNYAGKDSSTWDANFGYLTANYPVFATEFGQYCDNSNYVATFLNYCQSKGIHWTAWAWYVSGCDFPSIISDWAGTPTATGALVKTALGGSGGTSPTAAPTAVPTVGPAGSNQIIYADTLVNGWSSYGWATDLTYSATAYVHSGTYSISFTPAGNAAVYVHQATPFDPRSYQSLQFYINGGTNSGQSLKVIVYDSSANVIGNAINLPSNVAAGSWVLQTISLSSFGISAGTKLTGFAIQGLTTNCPLVYIDDVTLVTAGTSPTTAPTKAPTAAPTSAPTAAPTARPTTAPTVPPTGKQPTASPTASPKPTAAPTGKATTAPTLAPTKGPTPTANATVKPTTAPTARPTAAPTSVSGTAATITVVLNDGNSVWWLGFNSFSGFPYSITAVYIKDSSTNAAWQSLANQGWGWTLSPGAALVAPVSIQLVSGQHVATLTNIVTNVNGGGSVTGTTTVS